MSDVTEAKVRLMPSRSQAKLQQALYGLKTSSDSTMPHVAVRENASSDVIMGEMDEIEDADVSSEERQGIAELAIEQISVGSCHLRQAQDTEELAELAKSIISRGVVQPILVRPVIQENVEGSSYEIIAGERRFLACKLAGLKEIPAIVRDVGDREALELAIIENLQRQDLNPVEQALSLKRLVEDFGANQSEVANIIGKNRATVSNTLRLLQLDKRVLDLLSSGDLSAGHGRALLAIEDGDMQLRLAMQAISRSLSVRALENMVAHVSGDRVSEDEEYSTEKYAEQLALEKLEKKVSNILELESLNIKVDPQGRKRLTITFPSEAAWKRFMARIRD